MTNKPNGPDGWNVLKRNIDRYRVRVDLLEEIGEIVRKNPQWAEESPKLKLLLSELAKLENLEQSNDSNPH